MKTKRITTISMLTAISVVIAIIESYFTFLNGIVPGLKLGLANIIIVFALYNYDFKTSLLISVMRVIIVSLVRTGFGLNFFFSLGGAIFSIVAMSLVKKTKLSIVGVSVVGSVFHGIGQVLVGSIILNNHYVIYYLPYLLLLSIPTGVLIGIIANRILSYDILKLMNNVKN